MFNEGDLLLQNNQEGRKKRLTPEQMQLQIGLDLDRIVKEYTSIEPSKLKSEDYARALNEIATSEKMAEKYANSTIDAYIAQKLIELKKHKGLSSQLNLKNMGPIKRIIRPGIGTHR